MSAAVSDEQVELPDPPMLRLGDREFPCRHAVPQWHLMRLARAMSGGDEMEGLAEMHRFLQQLIEPASWGAFDTFMGASDLGFAHLDSAIGDVLVEMGGRGKGSGVPSTPSSGGSPTPATPGVSRVVSLSRGTVEERPSLSADATSSGV